MPWHRGVRFYWTRGEIQIPVRGDGNRRSLQTRRPPFAIDLPAAHQQGVVDHEAGQRACRGEVEVFRQERGAFRSQAGSTQGWGTNQKVRAIRQDSADCRPRLSAQRCGGVVQLSRTASGVVRTSSLGSRSRNRIPSGDTS